MKDKWIIRHNILQKLVVCALERELIDLIETHGWAYTVTDRVVLSMFLFILQLGTSSMDKVAVHVRAETSWKLLQLGATTRAQVVGSGCRMVELGCLTTGERMIQPEWLRLPSFVAPIIQVAC